MLAVTHEHATLSRFARTTREGKRIWRSMYFGPLPSPADSSSLMPDHAGKPYVEPPAGQARHAQAFLIEQEPGATVNPHFHYVDQFQVVAAGHGMLGRHALAPLSVHYSAPCTGYGPIEPGEQGLSYFTLRAEDDQSGAQYLPAAKHLMLAGKRRNVIFDQITASTAEALSARTEIAVETLRNDDDGLAVMMYRIPAGQKTTCMDPAAGRGITLLVAAGNLRLNSQNYPTWSCIFLNTSDTDTTLQAGTEGVEVLAMRYPVKPVPEVTTA